MIVVADSLSFMTVLQQSIQLPKKEASGYVGAWPLYDAIASDCYLPALHGLQHMDLLLRLYRTLVPGLAILYPISQSSSCFIPTSGTSL